VSQWKLADKIENYGGFAVNAGTAILLWISVGPCFDNLIAAVLGFETDLENGASCLAAMKI
jgi:hypothetical protein